MNVTALEEYGLRCAVQLASLPEGKTLSAPDIAEREGLSIEYVSKFMLLLKRAELVRTVRGIKGGFALSRQPAEISLKEVLDALNGRKKAGSEFCKSFTGKSEACVRFGSCSIRPFWDLLSGYVEEFTSRMTLADLVRTEEEIREKTSSIASDHVGQMRNRELRS